MNKMLFYETSAVHGENINAAMSDMASVASAMDHVPYVLLCFCARVICVQGVCI